MMVAVAIALLPEPLPDRWGRLVNVVLAVATLLVVALFVYSMLDAYVL